MVLMISQNFQTSGPDPLSGVWKQCVGLWPGTFRRQTTEQKCALHIRISITSWNFCLGYASVYMCICICIRILGHNVTCISVGQQKHLENSSYLVFIICLPLGLIILTALPGHFILLKSIKDPKELLFMWIISINISFIRH